MENSYLGGGAKSYMTEACSATNCTMMEVGKAISSMMKLCGATKSTLSKVSGNLIMSVVIDVRRF